MKLLITTLLLLITSLACFAYVAPITGFTTVCVGSSTTLGDTTSGGTWSSGNPAIATVDGTGSVTGISAGIAVITYTAGTYVTATITVNPSPAPISVSGPAVVCPMSTLILTDATPGGSWSSSNPAFATVSAGVVTGVTGGDSVIISYTLSYGCTTNIVVTVNPQPGPIIGTTAFCNGATVTLSDPASPGGSWSTGSSAFTVGSASGSVTGISTGTGTISYTLPTGCYSTHPITVLTTPGPISGPASVCSGTNTGYMNPVAGGNWTIGATSIATIGVSSGIVSALNPGSTTITYTIGTGCSVTFPVIVNTAPAAIAGPTGICATGATHLLDATTGGSWASSDATIATINAVSGIASGVSSGSATITYTLSDGCIAVAAVTVYASPGAISGTPLICSGSTQYLSESSSGGTWSSSVPAIASVSTTGLLTGLTSGTTTISYTLGSGCTVTYPVTVSTSPSAIPLSGGGAYCAGAPGANISLTGSFSGINYQLFRGTTAVGTAVAGTGMALDFGPQSVAGTYTIVATNPVTGCTHGMTGSTVITVNPLPNLFNVTGGGTYCTGAAGAPVSLNGSQPGVNYQLFSGSSPVGTPLPGTGSILNFGFHFAGSYTILATNAATSCNNTMSGAAVIAANPLPSQYTVSGGGGYCAGGPGVHVYLSGSETGISYRLNNNGVSTSLLLYGSGSALDFGAQLTAGTYTIEASDTATGCSVSMTTATTVTVHPLPVVYTVTSNPTGGGYCSGGSGVHINLSLSQTGVIYQLVHGTTPMGTITGSGSALDFGAQTLTGIYKVYATNPSTGCAIAMIDSGNVFIFPLPSVYSVTGGGAYCSGGSGDTIGLSGSGLGIQYQLFNGGTAVSGAMITGTGSPISFGAQTAPGSYTIKAVNPATSCSSTMAATATVSVIPPVVPAVGISALPGDTVCAATAVSFSAMPVNGGTAPTYVWTKNGISVGTGPTKTLIPSDGDIIGVTLSSSATCATPATVSASKLMHVITVPPITGIPAACNGGSTTLVDTMVGGIWSTSDPAIAIISTVGGTTGVVTGIALGTVNMSYMLGSGCFSYVTVTIDPVPVISLSATPAACGGSYLLSATGGSGYSWAPSAGIACDTCATTNAVPASTTTYTVTVFNSVGCSDTASVTLNGNRISGHISYSGLPSDTFKVWLIQFNPFDSSLVATDSTYACMDGSTPYYEFDGKPAGSYMVKAKLLGQTPGTSGYLPTYSLSTPYWYAAASTTHTSATDTLHISMVYGVVPPGPGFIGGLISAGAGKGTSGDIAAAGTDVYLVDAVSGFVLASTITDAHGRYSFSNIAEGNYLIAPAQFAYTTVPSALLMLSGTADSANSIDFRRYDDSRVIRPAVASGIAEVRANTSALLRVYPNPTSGLLNLAWGPQAHGTASLSLADITGKIIFTSEIDIDGVRNGHPSSAVTSVDPGKLAGGIYILSVYAEEMRYTEKIVVQ